jgi:hypothetical protein
VTGQPHTALTSFERRQELATQGGVTEPENPGSAFWHPRRHRRADEQRVQQAEAIAEEARSAVLEAESRARAAEQEAARMRQELDEARKAGGLLLASEGSMLGELVQDISKTLDWLIDRDN